MKNVLFSGLGFLLLVSALACGNKSDDGSLSDEAFRIDGDKPFDQMSDDEKKSVHAELNRRITDKDAMTDVIYIYSFFRETTLLNDINKQDQCKESVKGFFEGEVNKDAITKYTAKVMTNIKGNEANVKNYFEKNLAQKYKMTPYQFAKCWDKLPNVMSKLKEDVCKIIPVDVKALFGNTITEFSEDNDMKHNCWNSITDFFMFAYIFQG